MLVKPPDRGDFLLKRGPKAHPVPVFVRHNGQGRPPATRAQYRDCCLLRHNFFLLIQTG